MSPTRQLERAIIVVLDGAGVGALPDAMSYDDEGSDTLGNIARKLGGLRLPVLAQLGLGCIQEIIGVACPEAPLGCFGRMAEASAGKDTTVGHWEMMGIITDRPFPTYPRGFPDEVIKEFERRIGRKTLGNRAASGTVIIEELGAEHLRTGYPIVYTSADSVFQIAAHEEVIPLEQLYTFSRIARELLQGEWTVDRVIARPFKGSPGQFVRTEGRKDFGLEPPQPTLLDIAKSAGLSVVGVGKIGDIFAHRGLTQEVKTAHNTETMHELLRCVEQAEKGIIFANLIDFDMLYGHRNDVSGFAGALAEFDAYLPRLMAVMQESDALFITADHGCDPTTASTDHSREYVPILCYGLALDQGVDLGTRRTFADLGATVSDLLGLGELPTGESFAEELLGAGSEDVGRRCPVGPSTVC